MSSPGDAQPSTGNPAFDWSYPYVAVYSVSGCLDAMAEFSRLQSDVQFAIVNGPLVFERPVARRFSQDGAAGVTTAIEKTVVGEGAYLVLMADVDPDDKANDLHAVRLRFAEIVGVLTLALPEWVGDLVLESSVCLPGRAQVILSDGPVRLTARSSPTVAHVTAGLMGGMDQLSALALEDRERFRLMARWIGRAHTTHNEVDQFLFYFVALEVFPAHGTSDVAGRVRDLLSQRAFPDIAKGTIKERLTLGPITGTREAIVHDGISRFPPTSETACRAQLEILRAVANEAMNLLLGRSYTGSLDVWVRR